MAYIVYGLEPASGGFGEWVAAADGVEVEGIMDAFEAGRGAVVCLADEADMAEWRKGEAAGDGPAPVDIRGRIHGEDGAVWAWSDEAGEWAYCLIRSL